MRAAPADEKSVPEVAKKQGVSSRTIYGWRKHFDSLEPADIKRLRSASRVRSRDTSIAVWRSTDPDPLKRAGHVMRTDRTHRLWRDARLQITRLRLAGLDTSSGSCSHRQAAASFDGHILDSGV